MSNQNYGNSYNTVIIDEVYQADLRAHAQKMLDQLEKMTYEAPATDELGFLIDPRKAEENKNSFIKQQKLSEAKQARKDQMRRGKR
jgi:hypothetical protein